MRELAKKLQPTATEAAIARPAMSLKNSSLEGKKSSGGSQKKDFSEEFEEDEEEGEEWALEWDLGFGRFFEAEDILIGL